MIILAIDSSRQTQSICLFDSRQSKTLAIYEKTNKSSQLISILADLLKECQMKIQDINLILVNIGPGSFTGIRSALTIIKTLAAELNLEIFAANNFELIRFEKNLAIDQALCISAGKNDYFISINNDYNNLEKNFFSLGRCDHQLLGFNQSNGAKLLVEYFLSLKNPNLINYLKLEPYYLREPSINKGSKQ